MKTRNVIILSLAGVVIFYLLYRQKDFDTSSYLHKIELLEQKVDSLHSTNKALNCELVTLESKLSEYDKEVDSLENRIVVIKRVTDEKLRNVNTLSVSELQRFFSERYNSSDPSGTSSETGSKGSN